METKLLRIAELAKSDPRMKFTSIASQITPQVLTNLKTKSNIYYLNGSIGEVKENPLLGINSDSFFIIIRYLHQELS